MNSTKKLFLPEPEVIIQWGLNSPLVVPIIVGVAIRCACHFGWEFGLSALAFFLMIPIMEVYRNQQASKSQK